MNQLASLRQKLNSLWIRATGLPEEFALRARIFHSVCFIVGVALLYNIPFNYAIDLPEIALLSLILFIIVGLLYYNSRVRNQVSISITLGLVAAYISFTLNYFMNSGSEGPSDVFLLLTLILAITIAPTKHYVVWVPLNVVIVMGLHFVEFQRPELVPFTYTSRFNQLADIASANIVVILLCFYCITYIRRQYEAEKKGAEVKSQAITEQNRMISSQNRELQRLNAEKNKLMSIIAHDLRSPLGSIQNSLEIITEYDLDSEDKQFMERELLQTTRETSAMLSKLLSWSKSQLTGISVILARHNLSALLGQTMESARSIATQKKIALVNEVDTETDIYADADMMEIIVRNIVGNAIKFTKAGGSIFISSEKNGQECWLRVRDTGIGIAADKQTDIFSLTAQSTFGTANEKGLGLGLLLCKEFIAAQSGRIWFESEENKGTSFYVSIPIYVNQDTSASEYPNPPLREKKSGIKRKKAVQSREAFSGGITTISVLAYSREYCWGFLRSRQLDCF